MRTSGHSDLSCKVNNFFSLSNLRDRSLAPFFDIIGTLIVKFALNVKYYLTIDN